jgi:oligoendopeptidase F
VDNALYIGVSHNEINSAADITALSTRISARYDLANPGQNDQLPEWISTPHHYQAPLYTINHTLGHVLSLLYFQQYRRDPKRFTPRYLALLKNGFDDTPDNLLRKFLNINFRDKSLIETALSLVKPRLDELEAIYAAQDKIVKP